MFMSSILIVKDWVLLTAGFYVPIFHSFISFNGKEKSLLLTAFCERTTTMPTRHFWLNWVIRSFVADGLWFHHLLLIKHQKYTVVKKRKLDTGPVKSIQCKPNEVCGEKNRIERIILLNLINKNITKLKFGFFFFLSEQDFVQYILTEP